MKLHSEPIIEKLLVPLRMHECNVIQTSLPSGLDFSDIENSAMADATPSRHVCHWRLRASCKHGEPSYYVCSPLPCGVYALAN